MLTFVPADCRARNDLCRLLILCRAHPWVSKSRTANVGSGPGPAPTPGRARPGLNLTRVFPPQVLQRRSQGISRASPRACRGSFCSHRLKTYERLICFAHRAQTRPSQPRQPYPAHSPTQLTHQPATEVQRAYQPGLEPARSCPSGCSRMCVPPAQQARARASQPQHTLTRSQPDYNLSCRCLVCRLRAD